MSSIKYKDWREIQDNYKNYMASLDFETIDEIIEYLVIEYKITSEKSKEIVSPLNVLINKTIEIEF